MIYNNRSHFYTMRRANHSLMRAILTEGINPYSYLGHGTFSVVFATGEETVAKLTVDPVTVRFCEEARFSYNNPLFPKVFAVQQLEQEVVGFGGVKLPLYRIDCERLIPIKRQKGSVPWSQSLRIRRALKAAKQSLEHHSHESRQEISLLTNRIAEISGMSQDFAGRLVDVVGYLVRDGSNRLDIHNGNLMQRANGEVVINDIICTKDLKVWNAVRKYTGANHGQSSNKVGVRETRSRN